MSAPIVLEVVGVPAPQGSKTRMPNGVMVDGTSKEGRAKLAAWRDAVRRAAADHMRDAGLSPLDEPVRVTIDFRFAPTKSDPYRTHHVGAPDVDKLIRATFDALKHGGLLRDDSIVADVTAGKRYCEPGQTSGAVITVHLRGHVEAGLREHRKQQAADARRKAKAS